MRMIVTLIGLALAVSAGRAEEQTTWGWTIDEAAYCVAVSQDRIEGVAKLSGKTFKGASGAVPLFNGDIVIAEVKDVSGGMLVHGEGDSCRVSFLPDGSRKFRIDLSFLAKVQEDSASKYIALGIPSALQNSLRMKLPAELRLVENPGIADREGIFHFPSRSNLTIRFADRQALSPQALVEIDTFSRIRVHGKRVVVSTSFLPARAAPGSLTLHMPEGGQFVESSLKASWIRGMDQDVYELRLPPEAKGLFSMEVALEETSDTFSLRLPHIQGNSGSEGCFVVEEPDDGQISISGKGLVGQIPATRLPAGLAARAGESGTIMRMPPDEQLNLAIKRFETVSTPAVVLAEQHFFSSFEENGNVLSVLIMDVPPQAGQRTRLKSVPDVEVWSLTVNGHKTKLYTDGSEWVIPLVEADTSHVELAFLRHGTKLGLQGRLETTVPETGFPSKIIRVGLALPERVDLLSIEGPVSPDDGKNWKMPEQMAGRPHFFNRLFHKGDGMKLLLAYKEPVKQK